MAKPGKRALAFGWHAVAQVLRERPQDVLAVTLLEGRRDQRAGKLLADLEVAGVHIGYADRERLDRLAAGASHQGIVAEVRPARPLEMGALSDLVDATANPLLLILDGVQDPGNLGACLRTADGAGVTAVVIPRHRAAPLNDTVRKVACGAAETVPVVQVTNLARALEALRDLGVRLIGTSDRGEGSLFDADLTGPLGIVMGGEARGLRRLTREGCDQLVALPMAGAVSSLNVSVATGICLYEAVRQRGARLT